MRLEWAIPCLSVSLQDNLVARIETACFDQLGVPALPAPIEFIVLVRALGQREEFMEGADRTVKLDLKGPALEDIISVEFELPSGDPAAEHPSGWEMNAIVPIVVQFTAEDEGAYLITFEIGGRVQRCSVPFRITTPADSTPAEISG